MFTISLVISSTVSFCIVLNIGNVFLADTIFEDQQALMTTFYNLTETTDVTLKELTKSISSTLYVHEYFTEDELLDVTSHETLKHVLSKEEFSTMLKRVVTAPNRMMVQNANATTSPLMLFYHEGEYLLTYINEKMIFELFAQQPIGISLILTAIISFVIMNIGARRLARPIKRLARGLDDVSKGQYGKELPVTEHDEIGKITRKFNEMTRELQSVVLLRRDFTNNICHELKTPLASIQGFSKMLQLDDLSDKQRLEYTQIINDEAKRLSQMSVNILSLSKLENQTILENVECFNFSEEVRKVFLLLEPLWSEKALEFEFMVDEVELSGNKELLTQVILNIFSNAIKFSKPQGYMEVKLFETGHEIHFSVRDTGVGMSEFTKKRVFESFYQGDEARHVSGHGIGLPLAKRIVVLHGGRILIDSIQTVGTKVSVILPKLQ